MNSSERTASFISALYLLKMPACAAAATALIGQSTSSSRQRLLWRRKRGEASRRVAAAGTESK